MQEHLGPVMNLARIKLLAFVLHAPVSIPSLLSSSKTLPIIIAVLPSLRELPLIPITFMITN